LGAEIELWIDGEQNLMKEASLSSRQASHCPLNILNCEPVFHLLLGRVGRTLTFFVGG
jgi:hypothetical protein